MTQPILPTPASPLRQRLIDDMEMRRPRAWCMESRLARLRVLAAADLMVANAVLPHDVAGGANPVALSIGGR
jgi:hypothetical protein